MDILLACLFVWWYLTPLSTLFQFYHGGLDDHIISLRVECLAHKTSFTPQRLCIEVPVPSHESQRSYICLLRVISLILGFRRNFLSVLHPNLVSSPIKGILEIFYLTTRCIPMDILAWTDCVRSSAGKIS